MAESTEEDPKWWWWGGEKEGKKGNENLIKGEGKVSDDG